MSAERLIFIACCTIVMLMLAAGICFIAWALWTWFWRGFDWSMERIKRYWHRHLARRERQRRRVLISILKIDRNWTTQQFNVPRSQRDMKGIHR